MCFCFLFLLYVSIGALQERESSLLGKRFYGEAHGSFPIPYFEQERIRDQTHRIFQLEMRDKRDEQELSMAKIAAEMGLKRHVFDVGEQSNRRLDSVMQGATALAFASKGIGSSDGTTLSPMEKQQAHEHKMRKLELDHELEMAKVQAGISSNNAAISANNLMLDRSSKEVALARIVADKEVALARIDADKEATRYARDLSYQSVHRFDSMVHSTASQAYPNRTVGSGGGSAVAIPTSPTKASERVVCDACSSPPSSSSSSSNSSSCSVCGGVGFITFAKGYNFHYSYHHLHS